MASNDTQPMDKLKEVSQDLMKALGDKAMGTISDKVGGLTDKFEGIADGIPGGKAIKEGGKAAAEGDSPVMGALKGAASSVKDKVTGGGGGGGGGGKATKSTNIIETIDVGVPVTVAYNQWTEFGAFPSFMKKVKSVEAVEDNKITFKAKIFWSQRTWESTIIEQVPDERIVWKSKGEKGHVDGAVTFHEIGPNLTRILVVLEYYPKGLFEKTGNIWEAQGRRARAELRHFRRHVMTRTILNPDEVEGWRGVIEDGEVVQSHDEVVEEEEQEQQEQEESEGEESDEGAEDEYDEPEGDEADEESEEEPEDEYDDEEAEDEGVEDEDDEPAEEADEDEADEEEPEDEYEEEDEEEEEALDEVAEDEDPEEDEESEDEADDVEEDEAEYEEDEEEEPEEEEPKPRRRRRAS
ncbi:MAG: SRPBCC family protein [Candidatus Aminicenantales bacterium]